MSELASGLAPGWDALEAPLRALYGRPPDAHYGTMIKYALGGPDPLDGFSVWRDGEVLHYLTYGFTELYAKETEDPDVSGYGFELCFRLRHGGDDVPLWPMHLLQNLARYVFRTGNVFAPGHHLDANGPIATDLPTALTALAFDADPAFPEEMASPFGRFRLLSVVGVTAGEYQAMLAWNTAGVLQLLGEAARVTDLGRSSVAEAPAFQAAVAEGMAREGSSQGAVFVDVLEVVDEPGGVRVTLHARAAAELARLLVGRIPFGRGFVLYGPKARVDLQPAARVEARRGEAGLTVLLPEPTARELAAVIRPLRGRQTVRALPGVAFDVVPFVVRDREGRVVREEG